MDARRARCLAQVAIGAAEHLGTHEVRCGEVHGVVAAQAVCRGQIAAASGVPTSSMSNVMSVDLST